MRLDADVGLAEGSDLILMNAKWAVVRRRSYKEGGGEGGEYRGRPSWPQVDMGA